MLFEKKLYSILFSKVCDRHFPDIYFTQYHFTANNYNNNSKVAVYHTFMKNFLNGKEENDKFMEIYAETERIYKVFNRFYNNHVLKKTNVYPATTDMNLEPLYMLSKRHKFRFIHENTVYTFSVKDMIRIINSDLLAHNQFFSLAKMPRNPYNNISFTQEILYNFYLFLLDTRYTSVPEVFRRFVKCSLSPDKFLLENEYYIRERIIENYDKQLTQNELYEEIIMFLRSYRIPNLFIHIDFPKTPVIERFRTVIKYFWHATYNLSSSIRRHYQTLLNKTIVHTVNENPVFGRLILKRGYDRSKYPHLQFKITNLLDRTIPDYDSFDRIKEFMENGTIEPIIYSDDESEPEFNIHLPLTPPPIPPPPILEDIELEIDDEELEDNENLESQQEEESNDEINIEDESDYSDYSDNSINNDDYMEVD